MYGVLNISLIKLHFEVITKCIVRVNFISLGYLLKARLRNLAFNILGLVCKSQLRFDSCDITFTSNKRMLDWLIMFCSFYMHTYIRRNSQ